MKQLWMKTADAAEYLNTTRQSINVMACLYRKTGRGHVVKKDEKGHVLIDVLNFRHEKWAKPERIDNVKAMYYKVIDNYKDES